MIVKHVIADGFKNLEGVHIRPHEKYNLITGMNAQGKTNLIEAIWLMCGCKSFRGSKEKEFMGLDKRYMRMGLQFFDGRREQTINYVMSKEPTREKLIKLNGVKIQGAKLFEEFKCVVFTPDDIDLIKGGPEKRRSFIDLCACQLNYKVLDTVKRYDELLTQRNALLKNVNAGNADYNTISVWDQQLAAIGTALSQYRFMYIKRLNLVCKELYSRITGGREEFEIGYHSNIYGSELSEISNDSHYDVMTYFQKLISSSEEDIRMGYTHKGAHRDELIMKINGLSIKEFGSQGQKKTAALVLKLGQAELFYKKRAEAPVILLDDVMGELDESRQGLVFKIIDGMQVFITACNENAVNGLSCGKHFIVENGIVRESGE